MKNEIIIDKYGNTAYLVNNQLHREDGPAIECVNGDKYWYQNGLIHRENGAAIELFNEHKQWWYQGRLINCSSQEEFERIIRLRLLW